MRRGHLAGTGRTQGGLRLGALRPRQRRVETKGRLEKPAGRAVVPLARGEQSGVKRDSRIAGAEAARSLARRSRFTCLAIGEQRGGEHIFGEDILAKRMLGPGKRFGTRQFLVLPQQQLGQQALIRPALALGERILLGRGGGVAPVLKRVRIGQAVPRQPGACHGRAVRSQCFPGLAL